MGSFTCHLSSYLIKLLPTSEVDPGLVRCSHDRSFLGPRQSTAGPLGNSMPLCGKIEMSIPMNSETHFWELGLWK